MRSRNRGAVSSRESSDLARALSQRVGPIKRLVHKSSWSLNKSRANIVCPLCWKYLNGEIVCEWKQERQLNLTVPSWCGEIGKKNARYNAFFCSKVLKVLHIPYQGAIDWFVWFLTGISNKSNHKSMWAVRSHTLAAIAKDLTGKIMIQPGDAQFF